MPPADLSGRGLSGRGHKKRKVHIYIPKAHFTCEERLIEFLLSGLFVIVNDGRKQSIEGPDILYTARVNIGLLFANMWGTEDEGIFQPQEVEGFLL